MRVIQHQPRGRTEPELPLRPAFQIDRVATRRGTIVRVTGELDAASAPTLGAVLSDQVEKRDGVLLDLAGTTFIDSAGIRVLVRSMWDLRDAGASLQLVSASTPAETILRITGILDVLKEPEP